MKPITYISYIQGAVPAHNIINQKLSSDVSIVDSSANRDSANISDNWQEQMDWQIETQDLINNLQKSFPKVDILYVNSGMSKKELSSLAAVLGKGSHLILSEDFLAQMGSSKESFEKGKAAIMEALTSLSSSSGKSPGKGILLQAEKKMSWVLSESEQKDKKETIPTKWEQEAEHTKSMLEQMKKYQEEIKKQRAKQKELRAKLHASDYRTAGAYAQLASAGSKAQVKGVMSDARRKIANLRAVSTLGDNSERMKARAAIKSYNTLLMRGSRKIRRLNEEELTRLREKQAKRKEQERKALQLKQEIKQQQTKRRSADRMIVQEGRLHDLNQTVYSIHHRNRYYDDEKDNSRDAITMPVSDSIITISPTVDLSAASMGGCEFTPADVTITEG